MSGLYKRLNERRREFSDLDDILAMKQLTQGIPGNIYYKKMVQDIFPHTRVVTVKSPGEYFKGACKDIDACVYSAEAGHAWAMLYPDDSALTPVRRKNAGLLCVMSRGCEYFQPCSFQDK